ncbi:MAG: SDR family NAD(P)-dependent oxidoreductase [Ahrensia sp.]|nr:SDR family NAD(P)-dependent oxidoreductase [Ahrensia sp.]
MSNWASRNCVIVGASGGIGAAFAEHLVERKEVETVLCLSRKGVAPIASPKVQADRLDYADAGTIEAAAEKAKARGPLDLVIVATGLLHDGEFGPEKSLRDLDAERLTRAFHVNTIGPTLVARHFLPLMRRDAKSVFAALSARVGSISDNRIGGWYGYRAAKSALNQVLRTAAIEHARRWKEGVVIGLHPGTVDTQLSAPFQGNVADGKLFLPAHATSMMLDVVDGLRATDTGKVFAYDGSEVPA